MLEGLQLGADRRKPLGQLYVRLIDDVSQAGQAPGKTDCVVDKRTTPSIHREIMSALYLPSVCIIYIIYVLQ